MTARAALESLLKARRLDVTLTSAQPWTGSADDRAATGVPAIDDALGGGLRRGHVSEIVGRRSSGRTTVMCQALAAAAARGESTALIDTHDRFDPVTGAAAGVDLSRLLWIRDTGACARALKAMNLVLQAGGFGLVVWDLADVPGTGLRALPFTTWFRLARVIEGSQTVAVIVASAHVSRSAGGATIQLAAAPSPARWIGPHAHRARVLRGIEIQSRVVGGERWQTSAAPSRR